MDPILSKLAGAHYMLSGAATPRIFGVTILDLIIGAAARMRREMSITAGIWLISAAAIYTL